MTFQRICERIENSLQQRPGWNQDYGSQIQQTVLQNEEILNLLKNGSQCRPENVDNAKMGQLEKDVDELKALLSVKQKELSETELTRSGEVRKILSSATKAILNKFESEKDYSGRNIQDSVKEIMILVLEKYDSKQKTIDQEIQL